MNEYEGVDYPGIIESFQKDGYVVVKRIIAGGMANTLRTGIEYKIDSCAQQLGCTKKDYLSAVSRWVEPSIITSVVTPSIIERLAQVAQTFIKKPVQLKKMNVICKNAHCTGPIAYHQDISYSPQDPYEFSMWIALDHVSLESAPLEVIPGSHLLPLKSAVDFWSPYYKPDSSLKFRALKLSVEAGDVIFFDSRLWHGSGDNKDLSSRYALVIRWSSEGWQFNQPIPTIEPDFFGLWTSGQVTEDILKEGLTVLFKRSEFDFIKLIDTWMQLIQEWALPFPCDVGSALESFKDLKILHLAHTHHNGGDAMGIVYRNFWQRFLSPLRDYVLETQTKRNVG